MPDYCTNKLSIDGHIDAVNDAMPYFINEDGNVDFSILCPIPALLTANRYTNKTDNFVFTPLPPEAYGNEGLLPLGELLSTFINSSMSIISSSMLHMAITNATLIKLKEQLEDTVWADLNKDIVFNLQAGTDYLNLHEPTPDKIHKTTVETLASVYYLLYTAPYCLEQYEAQDWYYWCLLNWGTKFNAHDIVEQQVDGIYKFVTTWSAPTVWFSSLVDKLRDDGIYVNLTLAFVVNDSGGEIHYTAEGEKADIVYNEAQVQDFLSDH